MAFQINGIVVDRIQIAVAESLKEADQGAILYTLTQLNTASIETTADSTDAVDQKGNLIKRFYNAKNASFTATNAFLDLNAIGGLSGDNSTTIASDGTGAFVAPKVEVVKVADATTFDMTGYVAGTVAVAGVNNQNAVVEKYTLGTAAADKKFAIAENQFVPPTKPDASVTKYLISFDRTVNNGIKVINSSKDIPSTVKLVLKCLAIDPCHPGELKALYVTFPSFQPSPEVSFDLATDATFDYSGDAQVDYCGEDQALYILTWADEDQEDSTY